MERRIRRVDPSDAQAVRAIYAPFVSDDATSFEMVVPDPADMQRRIQAQRDLYPWLVFERDHTILGYAYASPHRARQAYQWCVEVSVYVHPQAHRCGVGRALYLALFDLLRRQGYVNAYAGITLPNSPSIGLHESLGFVPVGVFRQIGFKFDRWHDVAWLHLRLREDPRPPSDPLPAAAVWQESSVPSMLDGCAQAVRLDQVSPVI
jgi:L-amino acid N-acyltransferase YncA